MRISKKHGVDVAVPRCYFCGETKNEFILAGALPKDAEAPRNAVWDMAPCDKCEELMNQGVILISVRNGDVEKEEVAQARARDEWERNAKFLGGKRVPFSYMPNPYRTGGWIVVKDHVIEDMVNNAELVDHILGVRWCFIPDEVWDAVGFPRE